MVLNMFSAAKSRNLPVDDFAPRLSFFFAIGMNFFMEIAKLRAARTLWFELMQQFEPQNPKSSMLRTHCQTSGYSLTEQDPYNNIVRTTVEAMAATLGGTQSLHTNAFDEAIALPTETSARIARNTQLILQEETDLTATVDPFGGSYFMEKLTSDLIAKARTIIDEVEALGGMVKAVGSGMPKIRIEESAAKKQARIDSAADVIVGVNKYQAREAEPIESLNIDNATVRETQIKRLKIIKETRVQEATDHALLALRNGAKAGKRNLLELCIEAVRQRATVGEISATLAEIFGRHQATTQSVSAVYSAAYEGKSLDAVRTKVKDFATREGRNARVLVVKLGQDGHDRGSKVIATGLADLGFDVDIGPLFQTPKEAAKQAIENDVHVVGVSSQAAGHRTLVPALIDALKDEGAGDILVVVGGIIPQKDYEFLKSVGTAAIFGPGTPIPTCAEEIIRAIEDHRSRRSSGG